MNSEPSLIYPWSLSYSQCTNPANLKISSRRTKSSHQSRQTRKRPSEHGRCKYALDILQLVHNSIVPILQNSALLDLPPLHPLPLFTHNILDRPILSSLLAGPSRLLEPVQVIGDQMPASSLTVNSAFFPRTHLFLHPGHWTITIPLVYALFVNVCDERCPHPSTVHVNVNDSLGSSGFSNVNFSPDGGGSPPDSFVGAQVEKLGKGAVGRGTRRCCSEKLA